MLLSALNADIFGGTLTNTAGLCDGVGNMGISVGASARGADVFQPVTAAGTFQHNLLHAASSSVIGVRLKYRVGSFSAGAVVSYQILRGFDASGWEDWRLSVRSTGTGIANYHIHRSGITAGIGALSLVVGQEYDIEVRIKIAGPTTGEGKLWVDGVVDIDVTGKDLNNTSGPASTSKLDVFAGSGVNCYDAAGGVKPQISDLVVYDDSGSEVNTFPQDALFVYDRVTTSDDATQFTRSAGSNSWELLDDKPPDGDTTYVESSTVGHKDTYGYAALPASAGSIKGVIPVAIHKQVGTARSIGHFMKSGASESTPTAKASQATYKWTGQAVTLNPATSTAWTKATVEAAKVGITVVA